MDAARNSHRHNETGVRPLLEAAVDLAMAGIPVLPSNFPVPAGLDDEGGPRFGCSCARDDCPTPARHLMAEMGPADASTDPVRVAQWWSGGLREANIAALTGQAFDVVELRHPGRPEDIRAWLAEFGIAPGPVLDVGIGRVRFLTTLGDGTPSSMPAMTEAVPSLQRASPPASRQGPRATVRGHTPSRPRAGQHNIRSLPV
jgi:hypothetical protein